MDGRELRDASARETDGFWYTENMSRPLPPPPGWDPIAAGAAPPCGALPERCAVQGGAGDERAI
jgi:hypothetical protein